MKNDVLVSIIIPVYNVQDYIEECIISCVKQTYSNIEIIAVDDGSKDNSLNILNDLSKKYPKLSVIHKKNGGVSSARNCGLKEAKGDYVLFIDADDYISYDAIQYMLSIALSNSSDFVILKNCFTKKGQTQFKEKIISLNNEEAISLLLGLSMELGCWNKLYSRDLLVTNNILFNENLFYGEGLHFILNVAQKANNIFCANQAVYFYRKNNLMSATSSFNYKKVLNGEKSLLAVKDNLQIKSNLINDTWKFHYTMFAQNALISCINNKKLIHNYRSVYKEWKFKFGLYFTELIKSKNISNKEKFKLFVIKVSPSFFAFVRNLKVKNIVKRSV